jgi:hypothetical protein
MGYTAAIRFTAPVDPRDVWAAAQQAIHAPLDFQWRRYAAGADMNPNARWNAEPEQGANALASMDYMPEGALLDDSEYTADPDDYGPAQIPPPGYVEVHLNTGYSATEECIAAALDIVGRIGVRAAIRDDFTGEWSMVAGS